MGSHSKIEWTDYTFNPWWGCRKVSPGCDFCYAETIAKRAGFQVWDRGANRRMMTDAYWRQPLSWNRRCEKRGERRRVFCGSMCDVMEDAPGLQEIRETKLYPLIEATPLLDWILLTKRPHNFQRFLPKSWLQEPRRNVIGMTTVESKEYLWRTKALIDTPFAWRGVSMEPLLGSVDIGLFLGGKPGIDWVIVGGESGANARPMHPDWVRKIRDKCKQHGVAFFFKQWGEWLPSEQVGADGDQPTVANSGARWGVLSIDGEYMEQTTRWMWGPGRCADDGEVYVYRVGRRNAGRFLDKYEYSEYPAMNAPSGTVVHESRFNALDGSL